MRFPTISLEYTLTFTEEGGELSSDLTAHPAHFIYNATESDVRGFLEAHSTDRFVIISRESEVRTS